MYEDALDISFRKRDPGMFVHVFDVARAIKLGWNIGESTCCQPGLVWPLFDPYTWVEFIVGSRPYSKRFLLV